MQFRERGEVAVSGEQSFYAVRNTNCCDAGVVYGTANDMGPIYEPAQNRRKVASLADQPV